MWLTLVIQDASGFKLGHESSKVETVHDFMATFELEGQRFHALKRRSSIQV